MNNLRLDATGQLAFFSCEEPAAPLAGEALVQVHRIGVCGTDVHAFAGRQPFFTYPKILGHELGVEVLAVGENVTNIQAGDRCSVEPYLNCETCIACRSGKPNCCVNLQVLGVHADGGMRERFVLPARKLHASSSLSFDQLALVETLGIGAHAVARSGLKSGEFALIIGAGPIGLAAIQFALERGAEVAVLDIHESRLDFCQKHLGVSHLINGQEKDLLKKLLEITNNDLPSIVFDATGNPKSMMTSFEYVAHGGRLVFVGLFQGDVTFNDPNFHRRELTVMASRNALPEDFSRIIHLVEAGRIDTTSWITHRARFDSVPEQFPAWTRPETGVIKAMIEL